MTEQLAREISRRGGLFTKLHGDESARYQRAFSAVQRRFRHVVATAKHVSYTRRPREVLYNFTNQPGLAAFSYASPSNVEVPFDFVGVSARTVYTVVFGFQRMLAHPAVFPRVGDVSMERSARAEVGALSLDVVADCQELVEPNCPVRWKFALILALTALDFLFAHELGHAIHGHLEFTRDVLGAGLHDERAPGSRGLDTAIAHALEADADERAVRYLINAARTDCIVIAQAGDIAGLAERIALITPDRALRTAFLAVYLLLRITNRVAALPDERGETSHPPAALRLLRLGAIFHTNLESIDGFCPAQTFKEHVFDAAVEDAEVAFGAVRGVGPDLSMLRSIGENGAYVREWHDRYRRTWLDLVPHLDPFARCEKLPA